MGLDVNARDAKSAQVHHGAHFGRHLLIGFFTIAPLWVTWLVFDFLLDLLAGIGRPILLAAASLAAPVSGTLAAWFLNPAFQKLVAVLFTLALIYGIGLFASMVLGRKLIAAMEAMLNRLPLVQTVYGCTKRFLQALRKPPVYGQRVVLISFPTPKMKALGFVTKIIRDEASGRDLAAVYVPTSPNPTSGYIEIVPLSEVVQTDWSIEEAMSFVMTGGANGPDSVHFDNMPRNGRGRT